MKSKNTSWTKEELQIYTLLLCANADSDESEDEVAIIKTKTNTQTFNKIYAEFSEDSEDESLRKIDMNIHNHDYSHLELAAFKKEIYSIFSSDNKFNAMEQNINRILDNILY